MVSIDLWNQISSTSLFEMTLADKKHFSLRHVHFQKLHNVAVSRGRPGGRPDQMGQSTSHSCGVWSGSWAVSFCGCHLHAFFCSLSLVDLSLFPKYMWARAYGGPLPGCSLGCNGIFMAVSNCTLRISPFQRTWQLPATQTCHLAPIHEHLTSDLPFFFPSLLTFFRAQSHTLLLRFKTFLVDDDFHCFY